MALYRLSAASTPPTLPFLYRFAEVPSYEPVDSTFDQVTEVRVIDVGGLLVPFVLHDPARSGTETITRKHLESDDQD